MLSSYWRNLSPTVLWFFAPVFFYPSSDTDQKHLTQGLTLLGFSLIRLSTSSSFSSATSGLRKSRAKVAQRGIKPNTSPFSTQDATRVRLVHLADQLLTQLFQVRSVFSFHMTNPPLISWINPSGTGKMNTCVECNAFKFSHHSSFSCSIVGVRSVIYPRISSGYVSCWIARV